MDGMLLLILGGGDGAVVLLDNVHKVAVPGDDVALSSGSGRGGVVGMGARRWSLVGWHGNGRGAG